ncbi:MAG: hypothetical protein IJ600_02455 [Lachnospiraceae bacterium]|nr:hypothetical protein [Lachnospiraceae bacterium]
MSKLFLYLEMILATPGAKLHRGFRRLRRSRDLTGAFLIIVILLVSGMLLWHLRSSGTHLLLFAGAALTVLLFFLFFPLLRGTDTLLGIGEMVTYPFSNSYEQCRETLKDMQEHPELYTAQRTDLQKDRAPQKQTAGSADAHARDTRSQSRRNTQNGRDAAAQDRQDTGAQRQQKDRNPQSADTQKQYRAQNRQDTDPRKQHAQNAGAQNDRSSTDAHHRRTRRSTPKATPLEEAKSVFGVELPFTADEIRQRRNLLLKKYHPDNPDGSEEMCKKINEWYALLLKYAS